MFTVAVSQLSLPVHPWTAVQGQPAVTTVEQRPVREQHQDGSHRADGPPAEEQHQDGSHRADGPPAETGPAPDRDDGERTAPDGNIDEDPDRQGDQSDLSAELPVHL